jgi:hypothetical protein
MTTNSTPEHAGWASIREADLAEMCQLLADDLKTFEDIYAKLVQLFRHNSIKDPGILMSLIERSGPLRRWRLEAPDGKVRVEVTKEEIGLLYEALDSHAYWQLSDPKDRNSGFIIGESAELPEVKVCEALAQRLVLAGCPAPQKKKKELPSGG